MSCSWRSGSSKFGSWGIYKAPGSNPTWVEQAMHHVWVQPHTHAAGRAPSVECNPHLCSRGCTMCGFNPTPMQRAGHRAWVALHTCAAGDAPCAGLARGQSRLCSPSSPAAPSCAPPAPRCHLPEHLCEGMRRCRSGRRLLPTVCNPGRLVLGTIHLPAQPSQPCSLRVPRAELCGSEKCVNLVLVCQKAIADTQPTISHAMTYHTQPYTLRLPGLPPLAAAHHAAACHNIAWCGMAWHARHGMAWHGMAWHGMHCCAKMFHEGDTSFYPHTAEVCDVLDNTVLHCIALHCTTPHYTALHCTALHCTALHCTAPHCTAVPRHATQ
eukprot:358066-Chlamydomonas_euryale.AAC.6